ncbi:DUF2145 domain-containing protein [Aliiglaciecola sp. LCG003]|uniref:DUF2145 domain-containing protein n=1 Tax=Aliiglaciecola sp. LCG003 TaxID=3053655 RepID=UPI0025741566|nr:DUF2145 domain-containing protein [Aliiglaciecola sp. LCG003]WJG09050.1 DUF2145 domain-containing protein [Aliiglaciecola sp. LCG003]
MKVLILLIATTFLASYSFAGSPAQTEPKIAADRIMKFAKNVEKYAAANGARAFILSRVGRPQKDLPKWIEYTHTAIAIYSDIQLADGSEVQGYAIHNLYQDSNRPNRSVLVTDYPVDFFWGAYSLKTGIIIPTEEVQTRIIDLIANSKDQTLHNQRYSVISNPNNSQFQNCTEYTLDIVNAAIYQTTDIERLKLNAQAYFSPQRLHVSRLKLALGSIFSDELTTKDHNGKVYTATYGSIRRYMQEYQLASASMTLFEDGSVVLD